MNKGISKDAARRLAEFIVAEFRKPEVMDAYQQWLLSPAGQRWKEKE